MFTELITYILVNVVQVLLKYAYSFTDSVGEDAFSVNIVQDSGARARVWPQLLDRHDGSYILRYKMHQSYKDMRIEIKYGDKHVAQSPYKLHGKFFLYHFHFSLNVQTWRHTCIFPTRQ